MAEEIKIPKTENREQAYQLLMPQIEALVEPEPNLIANLANVAAVLKTAFSFFWVGFYFVEGDELVLGPFQGPVACTRFPVSKGVCGAAVRSGLPQVVPDVDQFPGHIACSADSRSEIVLPLVVGGKPILVFDIDSDQLDDFTEVDTHWLQLILDLLAGLHFRQA